MKEKGFLEMPSNQSVLGKRKDGVGVSPSPGVCPEANRRGSAPEGTGKVALLSFVNDGVPGKSRYVRGSTARKYLDFKSSVAYQFEEDSSAHVAIISCH